MLWRLPARQWLIYMWKYPQIGISVWSPVAGWWWRRRPWQIEWTYCRKRVCSAIHLSLEVSFASDTRKREISRKSTHWVWPVSVSTDLYMLRNRPKSRNVWFVESKLIKKRHMSLRYHLVTRRWVDFRAMWNAGDRRRLCLDHLSKCFFFWGGGGWIYGGKSLD